MKNIAIICKRRQVADFCGSFFKKGKIYRPSFFHSPGPFLEYVSTNSPAAVLSEDSFVPMINHKTTKIPVIAFITGEIEIGLETAAAHNVDSYIYPPYLERDLAYKLEKIILSRGEFDAMKREIWELRTCIELSRLVSRTREPKELLHLIVKKISEVMPVNRCSIIRVDWLRNSAFVVASHEDPDIAGLRLDLEMYPEILKSLKSKDTVLINDIATDPVMKRVREKIKPLGIKSILVIPVIFQEKIIGTLFLRTSRSTREFNGSEIQLLDTIAKTSANALYNAILFEQIEDEKTRLEKLAVTDFLTGLYNVRYFYQHIMQEFNRSERYLHPTSCLMLDIDHFKKINDLYGHRVGDLILKEFANLLKKYSRKSDVLARYGGEEFIILLPQTSLKGAVAEAERLRMLIKRYRFKKLKNGSGITVSIGISCAPHLKIKTHDDLIAFADDALFEAKRNGRDKVVTYK
jgi:two-component system, cell cycle response regulator